MNFNAAYKEARMSAYEGTVVSDRTYNLSIGLVILWGLFINFIMYRFFAAQIIGMNYLAVILLYFAGSIGGMMIVYRSRNPVVSLLGFTILAIAMGLLLTSLLAYYSTASVLLAIRITGVTTCLMLVLAMIRPGFFLGLGRTLLTSLGICLVVQLVFGLIFRMRMGALDWVVALIFCGYIGYDWAKAQLYPKTLDNAVDSAADIYV
ncbi:MAG: US12 family protein, partial [Oscillospiraceae bacterium]|nr:US12 family protein [Oscillospiraceae bacterium]